MCCCSIRLGELLACYAAADVAFVGGSLVPVGGHNLLEPAALGKPLLAGPHSFNAPEAARLLESADALTRVADATSWRGPVAILLKDAARAQRCGGNAVAVVAPTAARPRALAMIAALPPAPDLRAAEAVGAAAAGAARSAPVARRGRCRRRHRQQPVDLLDRRAVQVAGGQPQLDHVVQVRVLGRRVAGLRLDQQAARGQHVDRGAGAHFVAGFGGSQRRAAGFQRLLQRLHARDFADSRRGRRRARCARWCARCARGVPSRRSSGTGSRARATA